MALEESIQIASFYLVKNILSTTLVFTISLEYLIDDGFNFERVTIAH